MQNTKADKILNALLTYPTIREAASALGLAEKTIYNYLDKPDFKRRYNTARTRIIRASAAHIQGKMTRAIDVIASIMENEEIAPQVRLNAAKAILENTIRLCEYSEILERMEAIEEKLSE